MFDKTFSREERCYSTIVRGDTGGRYTQPKSKLFVLMDNKAKILSTSETFKGTGCDLSEDFIVIRTPPPRENELLLGFLSSLYTLKPTKPSPASFISGDSQVSVRTITS